ncbi:hypothetical protein [Maricaulis sp.]|uniref:hypothetical protein n=1 Tax=Maricaulis sp. TaxID=1486257 RepID=UPI002B270EED|nr:hypothetical protein [Maricaulis sp.]
MKHLVRTAALAALTGLAACSTPGYRTLNPSCLSLDGQPKYQRDGHQDTTYVIARLAGHSDEEAARLAFFNQAADDLALRYAAPEVSVWGLFGAWGYRHRINAVLHSLHGGDRDAVAQRRADLAAMVEARVRSTDRVDWQTGFLIHALGDSYAHTNPAGEAYGELYGHVFDGHEPDLVGNRRELYITYIEALFDALELYTASDRDALARLKRELRALPEGDVDAHRAAIQASRTLRSSRRRLDCDALARTLDMGDVNRFLREVEAELERGAPVG